MPKIVTGEMATYKEPTSQRHLLVLYIFSTKGCHVIEMTILVDDLAHLTQHIKCKNK
jgi:hypothetical protein